MSREEAGIDAWLSDADPVTRRVIEADQVLRLGRAGGDEPIGLCGELAFGLRAQCIERQPGACFGECQRVKRLHPCDTPRFAEPPADDSAMPVVAVDGAVRAALGLGMSTVTRVKSSSSARTSSLRQRLRRPDGEADEPAERRDQLLVGTGPVAAHENVRGHAAERETLHTDGGSRGSSRRSHRCPGPTAATHARR